MAAGDVTAEIVDAITATIDTRITALRVNANSKYLMCPVRGGTAILLVHIEEV